MCPLAFVISVFHHFFNYELEGLALLSLELPLYLWLIVNLCFLPFLAKCQRIQETSDLENPKRHQWLPGQEFSRKCSSSSSSNTKQTKLCRSLLYLFIPLARKCPSKTSHHLVSQTKKHSVEYSEVSLLVSGKYFHQIRWRL